MAKINIYKKKKLERNPQIADVSFEFFFFFFFSELCFFSLSFCLFPTPLQDTDKLGIETGMILEGSAGSHCPLPSAEGNKWQNPGERRLWTSVLPRASGTPRSTRVLIGSSRAAATKHGVFLKSAADPFYCLFPWEWQFNQRIQRSPRRPRAQSRPRGSTTETGPVREILSWRIHRGFKF